jgi:ribonuclease HI
LALQLSGPKPKGSSIVRAWFDGACWPNPGGHGGYGALVKRHGQVIYSKAVYLGRGPHISNNVAEYAGVIAVLRFLLQEGIQWATVYGDSQMVIKQLNGVIKARHGIYLPSYREARELRERLPNVRLVWVSRGQNIEADRLSKEALKEYLYD